MTTPPEPPRVRFVQGTEPGDRPALVAALARILIDLRRRDRERAAAGELAGAVAPSDTTEGPG